MLKTTATSMALAADSGVDVGIAVLALAWVACAPETPDRPDVGGTDSATVRSDDGRDATVIGDAALGAESSDDASDTDHGVGLPDGASDTEAARSRDGGCPGILGQACRHHVEPLDSPPQGFVLRALPLDAPLQGCDVLPLGFDLPGVPPLFRLVLRGQPPQGPGQLFLQCGHIAPLVS